MYTYKNYSIISEDLIQSELLKYDISFRHFVNAKIEESKIKFEGMHLFKESLRLNIIQDSQEKNKYIFYYNCDYIKDDIHHGTFLKTYNEILNDKFLSTLLNMKTIAKFAAIFENIK